MNTVFALMMITITVVLFTPVVVGIAKRDVGAGFATSFVQFGLVLAAGVAGRIFAMLVKAFIGF